MGCRLCGVSVEAGDLSGESCGIDGIGAPEGGGRGAATERRGDRQRGQGFLVKVGKRCLETGDGREVRRCSSCGALKPELSYNSNGRRKGRGAVALRPTDESRRCSGGES